MRWFVVLFAVVACSSPPESRPVTPVVPVTVTPDAAAPPSTGPTDAAPPVVSPIDLPAAPDPVLAKRLDAAIDKALAEQQLVGVVVMVARDGKLIYSRGAGFADREAKLPASETTMFRWASMTKPLTAVTALALIEQGKLGLDDPVTKYLPEFKPTVNGKPATITVRQLMTHTSGLSYRFIEGPDSAYDKGDVAEGLAHPGLGLDVFLKRLAAVPLKFEPGTAWHYGLSSDVLGAVIARAANNEFPAVVRDLILRPLGMTDTMFAVTERARLAWPYAEDLDKDKKPRPSIRMTEPYDLRDGKQLVRFSPARIFDSASFPSGGAGLAGTARDYLIFLEALRRGGAPILKAESVKAMTDNQIGELSKKTMTAGRRYGFGVGVAVDPKSIAPRGKGTWYWGGIYGTGFWVDPEAKLTVVMLTNVAGDTPFDRWVEKAIFSN